jgi:hypothetical protein
MSADSSRQLAFTAPRNAAMDAEAARRAALGLAPEPREDTSRITMATITPIFQRPQSGPKAETRAA